ncbi:MAG: alpha-1,2-fucosyltransferase [Bacteroidetes bacterium]|nr:alpha-1,2-fucosyltransferase [Bacteroidota bacterium]
MFQYAAGKSLAQCHNTDLKIDLSFLNTNPNGAYTKRNFELSAFKFDTEIASESEIQKFNAKKTFFKKLSQPFFKQTSYHIANEKSMNFDSNFFSLPNNTLLNGFWQSEKYFEKIKTTIQNDFQIKSNLLSGIENYKTQIINTNSLSLHVRRGDYVALQSANDFHGLCSEMYYNNAVTLIKNKHAINTIFVFSDDIQWCTNNLKFDTTTIFVETNSHFCDLHLMSLCKHNIIANSSFSWWAAWLNKNEAKTVIAPKHWFHKNKPQPISLIPKNWLQIE